MLMGIAILSTVYVTTSEYFQYDEYLNISTLKCSFSIPTG
ncbi:hypothetical protein HMPREF0083_01170 [Aneurinibacillus aneurinilyticus ATCC 12856]|uniref:Uncharacterized protein n=1 Tax=Aneurinibacillus aneurinilyticus ATCC 12856 TaxID=649747 RepID=U1YF93_ANEAE|nr:hypothetical protein HMPREF0083_01170 [Aneurinibacillus aneurinilyticus ATCC 12856]